MRHSDQRQVPPKEADLPSAAEPVRLSSPVRRRSDEARRIVLTKSCTLRSSSFILLRGQGNPYAALKPVPLDNIVSGQPLNDDAGTCISKGGALGDGHGHVIIGYGRAFSVRGNPIEGNAQNC